MKRFYRPQVKGETAIKAARLGVLGIGFDLALYWVCLGLNWVRIGFVLALYWLCIGFELGLFFIS
jgi:hypothetical protein